MYLLDSTVWITYLRGRDPTIRERLRTKSPRDIATCSVVLAELYYGALRSTHPTENRAKIDALTSPYDCLPFDKAAADRFGVVRRELEAIGRSIGPFDLQIAAIAMAHGCTLVTHNSSEFGRISNLAIEDWESP